MQILYEDPHIIVCGKEAGLPVQSASARQQDLESMLKTRLREKAEGRAADGEPYLGVVHRLDQPVRGLTVFAKNRKSAAALSAQAADGRMKKTYLAAVRVKDASALPERGGALAESRELSDLLIRDGKTNMSRVAKKGEKGAKKACLFYREADEEEKEAACRIFEEYEPLIRAGMQGGDRIAVLAVELVTGRHHQIRVQLSHAALPILGDRKYGEEEPLFLETAEGKKSAGPALAAWKLEFEHPASGKVCRFCL